MVGLIVVVNVEKLGLYKIFKLIKQREYDSEQNFLKSKEIYKNYK
jgi:hypothetical protein